MSEANVKAQAILIVIKTILKWIGLAIVGIGIVIFIGVQYDEYEYKKRKAIEDKVVIRAFHPKDAPCSKDFPYQYIIINDSGKTVEKVSFTVGIKRIGFSSEINRYTSIDEDKIIPNNESYGRCFRAEDAKDYRKDLTTKDVDIEITYKNITFEK
jgi:hypothetical protein